jgi:hypothetical protein
MYLMVGVGSAAVPLGRMGMGGGGGMMGEVMAKMSYLSMSIGLLGQGVQMLGMNAEMIQSAATSLIQALAQSTGSLNELVGCDSDRTTAAQGALQGLKPDPNGSGQFVPKTREERAAERAAKEARRRTARWVLLLAAAALAYWSGRRSGRRRQAAAALVDEFSSPAALHQPQSHPRLAGVAQPGSALPRGAVPHGPLAPVLAPPQPVPASASAPAGVPEH